VKSLTPKDDVAELDKYVFLIRKRLNKLLTPLKEITVTDLMIKDKKIIKSLIESFFSEVVFGPRN
jgi:hypothetical protein